MYLYMWAESAKPRLSLIPHFDRHQLWHRANRHQLWHMALCTLPNTNYFVCVRIFWTLQQHHQHAASVASLRLLIVCCLQPGRMWPCVSPQLTQQILFVLRRNGFPLLSLMLSAFFAILSDGAFARQWWLWWFRQWSLCRGVHGQAGRHQCGGCPCGGPWCDLQCAGQ